MVPTDLATTLDHALERDGREQEIFERMTAINKLTRREERDLSPEETAEWAELHTEFERLRETRGRNEALQAIQAEIRQESGMPAESVAAPRAAGLDVRGVHEQIGFGALNLLRKKGMEQLEQRDVLMVQGASGGYLVGTEMLQTILAVNPERQIIRPRALVIPAGDQPNATFEIPYFDQSTSVAGSIAFAHRKEDVDMTESDADFGLLKLEAKEQSTYIQIGKKTATNGQAVALGAFISTFFLREKQATEDYKFLNGTGNNEPIGMLNAACKISVTRNTSSQIKFADVTSMIVSLLDENGAIWIANRKSMAQIVQIADAAGNNLIYQPGNITQGIPATLFGIPLFKTTNTPSLGAEGDLMLVNPNYYVIKDGRPFELLTYDVRPEKQLLDFVGLWDVDGAPWVKSAITFKDGNSYSPIVVLK